MAPSSENEPSSASDEPRSPPPPAAHACMNKFRLYETLSNFYMIGRDKSRTYWRVLKIDRLDPSVLNVREDSTTYTESECSDLLRRIHEGNKSTGGLKFVTTCYGIVGFIKFLGPYYMVLITKRRQIGAICGHTVYAISKSEMIPLRNSSIPSNTINSKNENRYKKLLCMVDLTKDFFFSYSYHIMRSLQRNLCDNETGHVLYETMFVWNEFLTRGIRNHLQNTLWTVGLVYGFFKQDTLMISGREFILTLIARRSRHYAGTRYLRRGINEKGRVANDVETEQIVFEYVPEGLPVQISSVVQNRGSIPLFWSQETSRLNLKPDIILSKKDQNYQATRLHFENLVKRYGNPIIILNLIKTHERKPRESILRSEFANAIDFINKDLSEENRLRFLHWDLHKHFQSKATNVLLLLGKVAAYALTLTGFFYCQVTPTFRPEDCIKWPSTDFAYGNVGKGSFQPRHVGVDNEDANNLERKPSGGNNVANGNHSFKPPMFQRGVLRTNCIDCLDRTNVAQYAYGLAALGNQLHALGVIDHPKIDLDDPLGDDLMGFYERMGDTLAHQYGGSAAHNKIFSERRGQWRAATQSQEFFRTLQRYYSNAYMDAQKQDAINIFLGHFQPQQGKPALWELGSDQHYDAGRDGDDDARYYCRQWLKEVPKRVPPHKGNEICMGRNKCLKDYFPDPQERRAVTSEFVKFSSGEEELGQFDCLQDRWNLTPKEWWVMYGASIPKLQTIALKLLSQPSSSSCCERNWSTYSFIHSMKRNRLNPKRAEDLVFVHTNLRLLSRKNKNYNEGETKMWDIGGDEWDPFEGAGILEVANLFLDEPDLEAVLFTDDGQGNDEIETVGV